MKNMPTKCTYNTKESNDKRTTTNYTNFYYLYHLFKNVYSTLLYVLIIQIFLNIYQKLILFCKQLNVSTDLITF